MNPSLDADKITHAALRIGAFLTDGRVQVALIAIPITLALFVFFDAYRRGMNGLLWFLGILFTGGLLFPLYLLHAWNPQYETRDEMPHLPEFRTTWQVRAKYRCPYCTRGVIEGSVFCNRCGGRVDGQLREPYFRDPHPGATA